MFSRTLLLLAFTLFLFGCDSQTDHLFVDEDELTEDDPRDPGPPSYNSPKRLTFQDADMEGIGYDWELNNDHGFTRSAKSLIKTDLNGNGVDDYVTAFHLRSTVAVYLDRDPHGNPNLMIRGTAGLGFSFDSIDINSDGIEDLIVGQPFGDRGLVRIIYGSTEFSEGRYGIGDVENDVIRACGDCQRFGYSVSAGEVNGNPSFAVGAPGNVAGNDEGNVVLMDRSGEQFRITSTRRYTKLGIRVLLSDVDQNGSTELIVNSLFYPGPGLDGTRGSVWILPTDLTGESDVDDVFASKFVGSNQGDQLSSFAFGDFNGDGYTDVALGSRKYNYDKFSSNTMGKVYVSYGPIRKGAHFVEEDSDVSVVPFKKQSDNSNIGFFASGRFGQSIDFGDYNRDGIDDLLIGAFQQSAGMAYVIHGRSNLESEIMWNDFDYEILSSKDNFHFGRSVHFLKMNGSDKIVVSDPAYQDAWQSPLYGRFYIFK